MPFVTDTFVVAQVDHKNWCLVESLVYEGAHESFVVPSGFRTDFATVPRFAQWLIPTYGVYTRAAILHDWLCVLGHAGSFNRRDADGIFRRTLRELSVSATRRWLMWCAVRAGSRMSDATFREWLTCLAIAVPALLFLIVPLAVCLLWLSVFWIVDRVVGLRRKIRA